MIKDAMKDDKYERHMGINSAIDNLDSVEGHLDILIRRIQGQGSGSTPQDEVKPSDPSLEAIIQGGEDRIRGKIDMMHAKIESIEQMLF